MPDYNQGKIYAIRSHQTNQIYIGSTTNPLHKRLYAHRAHYKQNKRYMTSFEILKYDDNYIELIEMFPCNNKIELCKREGEIMRQTENCINRCIAGRTVKQWKEDTKYHEQYYEANKDQIKQYREKNKERFRKYRQEHKEKIAKKCKEWEEKNKEKRKQYRKENSKLFSNLQKLKIQEKKSKLVECECGVMISYAHLKRHTLTEKHQSVMHKVGLNVFGY